MRVRSQVVKQVTGKYIYKLLAENVAPEAHVMTDEAKVYTRNAKGFGSHQTVKHSAGEYVRGAAHVNGRRILRSVEAEH